MKKLKTTANTLVELHAKALIPKIWHGEPEIATYTVYPDEISKGSSSDFMFDDDRDTFWFAEGNDGTKRVEIEFNVRFCFKVPTYKMTPNSRNSFISKDLSCTRW